MREISYFMKKKTRKKTNSSDEPIGQLRLVPDFLPAPRDLLPKPVRITLTLDKTTVDFFKQSARNNDEKYQRMMREVLRGYASKYSND